MAAADFIFAGTSAKGPASPKTRAEASKTRLTEASRGWTPRLEGREACGSLKAGLNLTI
ncbi:MAG: hypothetical protein NTW93_07110 [Phycisphaerae bacterium]|nr:hypothetical protein [Phycisphaerae bacterium]